MTSRMFSAEGKPEVKTANGVILISEPFDKLSWFLEAALVLARAAVGLCCKHARPFLVVIPMSKGGDLIQSLYLSAILS